MQKVSRILAVTLTSVAAAAFVRRHRRGCRLSVNVGVVAFRPWTLALCGSSETLPFAVRPKTLPLLPLSVDTCAVAVSPWTLTLLRFVRRRRRGLSLDIGAVAVRAKTLPLLPLV